MAEGTLNANGSTKWFKVKKTGTVHSKAANDFGGGTLALEQQITDVTYPVLDADSIAITWTDDFNQPLDLAKDDIIRLTLSGATSPDINWSITGDVEQL